MKKKIEKLDDFGRGITYVNNKITFIPKCIYEDEVDFYIIDEKSKYFIGKINEIIKKSPHRKEVKCPFYTLCGGCSLQNLNYEDTLKFKQEKISNLLKKNKIEFNNITITENPKPFNYRNKITLKVVDGKIGFYEQNSHNIVTINKCLLAQESINKTIELLHLLKLKNGTITIRCNYKDEIIIIINTDELIEKIPSVITDLINLKGIVVNNQLVYKDSFFIDKVNDLLYEVSYDSFFQVNPYVAEKLFNKVEEHIDKDSIVYDLYCGVGALSLIEAKKCQKVIGLEIVKNAVINAVKNKKLNNISNAEFILRDLSNGMPLNDLPDIVVIDPPRNGVDKKTMNWLKKNKPHKIIYVSCDPNTLVRDIKLLDEYELISLDLFDMFSYTYHVESLCVLQRK